MRWRYYLSLTFPFVLIGEYGFSKGAIRRRLLESRRQQGSAPASSEQVAQTLARYRSLAQEVLALLESSREEV